MSHHRRVQINITGAVQGVGFRPFVFRLAAELGLVGWVSNSPQGVLIEAEGKLPVLQNFIERLQAEKPPHALIQSLEFLFLSLKGYTGFEIRHSQLAGDKTALILPDIATCPACLLEIFDPEDRRYLHPFTNCTHCGPRYSIITALPYDRSSTTMNSFGMCQECQAEYQNPLDRRFHAQPNACPHCGPHLEAWDQTGKVLGMYHEALLLAAEAIRQGKIVALKGLGGFQLLVDARNNAAVQRLRQRKQRPGKPLAVMCPTMDYIREHCKVTRLEEALLTSPEAPILLVENACTQIAPAVASNMPDMGVMLPYTGLHHILMAELGFPIVATSGNLAEEPICIDEYDALEKLGGIADLFLIHNRPIAHHVDDSVVQVVAGRAMILRRARGYAPLPIYLKKAVPAMIAAGAHLKNTIAISVGNAVFLSQHIGDLESTHTYETFQQVIEDFTNLYGLHPTAIACDLHPDYASTRFAQTSGLPIIQVQHHEAHILACMAENKLEPPVLGVAWDGTGLGLDGTIWGGEFLLIEEKTTSRVATLRPFRLPGGEKAVKEPRRVALGLLYELYGETVFDMNHLPTIQAFSPTERPVLQKMLQKQLNTPLTSSIGRLFDAVASLTNLRQVASFEGQAALLLEAALHGVETKQRYPFGLGGTHEEAMLDWTLLFNTLMEDVQKGVATGVIAAKFHNTLVEMIVRIAQLTGKKAVALTGGCFQNRYLLEHAIQRLREEDFTPYWHQHIPPNDGGIALGQIVAAARTPPTNAHVLQPAVEREQHKGLKEKNSCV